MHYAMHYLINCLSLLCIISCVSAGNHDVISLAASFHVNQFGPSTPNEALAKDLASVAIDIAAQPPAPCRPAMRLALITITSIHDWAEEVGGSR